VLAERRLYDILDVDKDLIRGKKKNKKKKIDHGRRREGEARGLKTFGFVTLEAR